jgi:tricorn protease
MRNLIAALALCILVISPWSLLLGQADAGTLPALCRFPTLHGNNIVFESGGNLWRVDRGGGIAGRLTTDRGYDLMPRFSPDGTLIAFTADYDDNTDVYVIPAEGGQARRLTFHSDVVKDPTMRWGPDNMVVTWTPDGKHIVFLSRRNTDNSWFGRLFQISIEGGLPEQLPLPKGGVLSYSPDGKRIAYNRIFRNFRTWKQYYGGLAQDVWIYDFATAKIERITDWKGTDTYPMWYNNTIYFASDRGSEKRLNLWAYDVSAKTFRQVTHFESYDIDWPSLGNDGIVFQDGGRLYVLDLPGEKLHELSVTVPDDGVRLRPHWTEVDKLIKAFDLAPNGKRALFGARGDLFTVPAEHGNTRNLTRTPGIREQYPAWSPDGKWVAYTTDRTGESEIAIRQSDGEGGETVLTERTAGYFYAPVWAPGSDKLAFSDNEHVLWYLEIKEKHPVKVDESPWNEIRDYTWSPDGLWLAYTKTGDNYFGSIYLYSTADRKATRISTGTDNDFNPAFDPGGKYLYFVSSRHENPTLSETELNIATLKMSGIYAATLQKKESSPFAPRSDEGSLGKTEADTAAKPKPWKPGASAPLHIDFDGLMERAVPLPVPSADINGLLAAEGKVLYVTTPSSMVEGSLPGQEAELHVFDMSKRKDAILLSDAKSYALSADGQKVLAKQKEKFLIIDAEAPAGGATKEMKPLDLSKMNADVDPVQEWREMFNEAWRLERDFFYSTKMNGKDWPALKTKYEMLVPSMRCRQDLNYLIGEMIGELQNSHTYVGGGDRGQKKYVQTGLLGVDFALDRASGRYRFGKIYPGDNSREELRSPLTEPGIDAREGDFLLAVNGRDLKAPTNPYSLFVNTLDGTVTLTVARDAAGKGKHDITVKPVAEELNLRQKAWIDHNREVVDKESGGKVGYVYLADMSGEGMKQFVQQFYPQIRKQGLIVDVRYNGGGFVDQIMLERLRRILVGMETNRQRVSATIPDEVLNGYTVALINHYSASDGDIFPYFFRKYGLGPLIGERTWGGVRGIRGYWPLMDGGYITIPEASVYGIHSDWVIENHGVDPDVEVDDLPGDVMAGKDAQLQAGIDYILKQLKEHPKPLPAPPPLLPAFPPDGDNGR